MVGITLVQSLESYARSHFELMIPGLILIYSRGCVSRRLALARVRCAWFSWLRQGVSVEIGSAVTCQSDEEGACCLGRSVGVFSSVPWGL